MRKVIYLDYSGDVPKRRVSNQLPSEKKIREFMGFGFTCRGGRERYVCAKRFWVPKSEIDKVGLGVHFTSIEDPSKVDLVSIYVAYSLNYPDNKCIEACQLMGWSRRNIYGRSNDSDVRKKAILLHGFDSTSFDSIPMKVEDGWR